MTTMYTLEEDFLFLPRDVEIAQTSLINTLYNHIHKQNLRFLTTYIDETDTLDIQTTHRLKFQITCVKNNINSFKITKFDRTKEVETLTFSKVTITNIINFLELISSLDIKDIDQRKISLNQISKTDTKNSISQLIQSTLENKDQAELLTSFLNNGLITCQDIVNTGYRKQQLDVFEKLLYEPDAITEYQITNQLTSFSEEKTWQHFFEKNEWIFGYGLDYRFNKILQREAHLNPSNLDGSNSVIVDYVMADNRFTTFVEIKRPNTPLFKSQKLRGNCWRISNDLYEAHSQILAQKICAQTKFETNNAGFCSKGKRIQQGAYDPKAILIIGCWSEIESDSEYIQNLKIRTFELFRRDLRNIEIITFDELYDRAKFIVEHHQ
ncbi:Shedu immune nuclease family protein [Acinetobacter sp. YH16052]|uniref:Shedu immune nuclease family protein n=1 Tax=Acinetobacter sp. YH16052 TaxID=2601191 RepID=UPI0015D1D96D|nr:Shedu immune nuclease family protein [Acinetobacter sp. YH16052]